MTDDEQVDQVKEWFAAKGSTFGLKCETCGTNYVGAARRRFPRAATRTGSISSRGVLAECSHGLTGLGHPDFSR
jgi:hypothetical protein